MKKYFKLSLAILIIALMSITLFACNDKDDTSNGQVPVYQGMFISGSSLYNSPRLAENDNPSSQQGQIHGDHSGRDNDLDQGKPFDGVPTIEEKAASTLQVTGSGAEIYYADKNQDIYITIKVLNPDSYEILSFTLNGAKYSSYMFESGSDMENLIIKVNVGNQGGIFDYTIDAIKYIDGTEINDVIMEGDKTVKAGVRAEDRTYVNITNQSATLTSLSFTANLVDLYDLVAKSNGYAKALLYDGTSIIKTQDLSVGQNNITFDNLTPNTLYQYSVVALYDNLSGDGIQLNTIYTYAAYTNTIVLFDDIQVTQDSVSFNYLWDTGIANKSITNLALYLDSTKVKDLPNTAESASGLLSNRAYLIKATYKSLTGKDETIAFGFTTLSKATPTISITNPTSTQNKIAFGISVVDADSVGAVTAIELYKGSELVTSLTDLTAREFGGLLSNNQYTLKATYTYNLNEGAGNQTIVKTANITTQAKAVPTVAFTDTIITGNSINTTIVYSDADSVGEITTVKLYSGNTFICNGDMVNTLFTTLDSYTDYTIKIEIQYNLDDGKGNQTKNVALELKTSPYFAFNNTTVLNTSAVSLGENIVVQANLDNPSKGKYDKVKINGTWYTVSNVSTTTNLRAEITAKEEMGGGQTTLTIEEIIIKLDGKEYNIRPTANNSASVFINGELYVTRLDVINENHEIIDYAMPSDDVYLLVTLKNPTSYDIDSIIIGTTYNKGTDILVLNNNQLIISIDNILGWQEYSVSSISYSNEYIEKTKAVDKINAQFLSLYSDTAIEISNANDLKNMSRNDPYYYKLTNDIDLDGIEWINAGNLYGYFDGNGYTVKNMRVVKTFENQDIYLGLFVYASGIIRNLSVENILFMVTTVSAADKIYNTTAGGLVAIGNGILKIDNICISGDISVTSGQDSRVGGFIGYTIYNITIANSNNAVNIDSSGDIGGLVGYAYSPATITNSYNTGDVSANKFVGGLVGYAYSTITITNSYNLGNVSSGSHCVGGLIGYARGNIATITNSYNTGNVSSNSYHIGGLIGYADNSIIITSSYNTGDISGSSSVGGLIGYANSIIITNSYNIGDVSGNNGVGGLIGYCYGNITITNSYNTGDVSGNYNNDVGGLVGYAYSTITITNSYSIVYDGNEGAIIVCTLQEIVDAIILIWDGDIWDFTNTDILGNPTLKG